MVENVLKAKGFKMKVMKLPHLVMTHFCWKIDGGARALPQPTRQRPGLRYDSGESDFSGGSNPERSRFEKGPVGEPNVHLESAGNNEAVFRPQAFFPSKASSPVNHGVAARNHVSI
jgi:hypothetical protein